MAAAHLRRYRDDADVGPDRRAATEIAWLVCWPAAEQAGVVLAGPCVRTLEAWGAAAVRRRRPARVGHVRDPRQLAARRSHPDRRGLRVEPGVREVTLTGDLDAVPGPGPAPVPGLSVRRSVGTFAARMEAVADGVVVGFAKAQDDRLRLGGTRRFLIAVGEDELELVDWFARFGWHPIGQSRRGWERRASGER